MNYSKWLFKWLENKKSNVKLKTYNLYKDVVLKYVVPSLGKYEIKTINSKLVKEKLYEVIQLRQISQSYLSIIKTIIKSSLNDYFIDKLVKPNIVISLPKINKSKKESFNIKDQRKLIEYIKTKNNFNLYGILICLYTGIRLGELLSLEWKDVDFNNKTIHINKTLYYGKDYDNKYKEIVYRPKTISSIRTIPLTNNIISILKELKKDSKTNYVIESRGKRQNYRSYQKKFNLILSKLNIRNKSFHCLRHTFATNSIEANIEVKVLSEILGHSSIKTTLDIYTTISNEFKLKEINKLNIFLNKKCSPNNLLDEPLYLIL